MSELSKQIILGPETELVKQTTDGYFDRQERISWWNQEILLKARVLVVGAGALGNEVIKNLALLGVGNLLIVDFDTIEDSNLSRTVLFRTADSVEGLSKARVAANRALGLTPNRQAKFEALHANVVWELGEGVYRHVDLVVGCLDNLEARIAVNLGCWRAGKIWIDGGIWELAGSVAVYDASIDKACYECGMTPDRYRQAKVRYSCTNETVKSRIRHGYEPTTQTTSAVVAAIQSQEVVKLMHNLVSFPGRQLLFSGAPHFYTDQEFVPMTTVELAANPQCICHAESRFDEVLELPKACASQTTPRQLIAMIESASDWRETTLHLGRLFVTSAVCPQCGYRVVLNRPLFRVKDVDTLCPFCETVCPTCGHISIGQPDCPNCGQQDISESRLETFHELAQRDLKVEPFLDWPLADLGIPLLHVMRATNAFGEQLFVELTGDLKSVWHS